MRYPELRARLDASRPAAMALVHAGEACLSAASAVDLGAVADDFPFSPRVWDAWLGNTVKLRGVKRIDQAPYATHPTRMALLCYWLLPAAEQEDSAVVAILHDYLEEGDGFSKAALAAMRARFPAEPAATRAAVVLSEPEISYARLGGESELYAWRRVAYTVQAHDAVRAFGGRAFANAALADKLDNLHDLGYIEHNRQLTPARRIDKLAVRLAFFAHVGTELRDSAHPALVEALDAAVAARSAELGLEAGAVEQGVADLARREREKGEEIRAMVEQYHARVGLG